VYSLYTYKMLSDEYSYYPCSAACILDKEHRKCKVSYCFKKTIVCGVSYCEEHKCNEKYCINKTYSKSCNNQKLEPELFPNSQLEIGCRKCDWAISRGEDCCSSCKCECGRYTGRNGKTKDGFNTCFVCSIFRKEEERRRWIEGEMYSKKEELIAQLRESLTLQEFSHRVFDGTEDTGNIERIRNICICQWSENTKCWWGSSNKESPNHLDESGILHLRNEFQKREKHLREENERLRALLEDVRQRLNTGLS
jgi:hypothetical protein